MIKTRTHEDMKKFINSLPDRKPFSERWLDRISKLSEHYVAYSPDRAIKQNFPEKINDPRSNNS